jgi:hypothetical protein
MADDIARNKLLHMIEDGDITPEDGLRLLNAFSANDGNDIYEQAEEPADTDSDFQNFDDQTRIKEAQTDISTLKKNKLWWIIPFAVGLILTIVGAIWMYLGYASKGFGWGFWLSWIPFGLGVVTMTISALSSQSKWIHIKVHEKKGKHPTNINLTFPIPLKFAQWFFHNFGNKIFKDKHVPADSIISMLTTDITDESPFYVNVDDESDHVEIFIG